MTEDDEHVAPGEPDVGPGIAHAACRPPSSCATITSPPLPVTSTSATVCPNSGEPGLISISVISRPICFISSFRCVLSTVSSSRFSADGQVIMWAIFVAPMKAGITTRFAPERSSFFSVEGDSARAMISIVGLSSRAVSVMNTLAESSGKTVASTRAG